MPGGDMSGFPRIGKILLGVVEGLGEDRLAKEVIPEAVITGLKL